MNPCFIAFSDELSKIAEAQPATRDRVLRAVKAAVPGAAVFGVGMGLGSLVGTKIAPHLPPLSPQQLGLVGGALGGGASLASYVMRNRFRDLVDGEPEEQEAGQTAGGV